MTQVPRAEAGQAEVWVTSPNDGEIRQVTVGLQCPVHCLLQAFNPLIPRWPEPGPARRTARGRPALPACCRDSRATASSTTSWPWFGPSWYERVEGL